LNVRTPASFDASLVADTESAQKRVFWQALMLRLLAAIVVHLMVRETMFAPDQETYHIGGEMLAQTWAGQYVILLPQLLGPGPKAYYYIVGTLYYVFGTWSLIPKIINACVGAWTVRIAYDLALRITSSPRIALQTATYTAFFPSLVLWSILNIRDVWIILLILLVCRQALVLQERVTVSSLAVLGGSIFFLVQFRDYILFPVTLPLLVSFFIRGRSHLFRNAVLGMLAASVIIYTDQAAGVRRLRSLDLEELHEIRRWNAIGANSGFEQADISTPSGALSFLPTGLALFLLAPFPWMIGGVRQMLAVPETLFFYFLLPAILRGFVYLARNHLGAALMVLLLTTGMTLGYALGEGNAGTAYRHRAQMLPFYMMFAAAGNEARRRKSEAMDGSPLVARL
jgi:hypothetical protein